MEESRWPACDICGQTVTRGNGRLLLKEDDVTEYWDSRINEERKRAGLIQGQALSGSDAMSVNSAPSEADRMPWHWGHEECLPDSRYMVVAKRFDNIRMLLDWTLYPPVDDLIGRTNWRETAQRLGQDAVA